MLLSRADGFVYTVLRTTERTTNLTVILFGAGLSAVLIYCLTSELFSKNSPTVLYGDACERIKASHRVRSLKLCFSRRCLYSDHLLDLIPGLEILERTTNLPQHRSVCRSTTAPKSPCLLTDNS